MNDRTFPVFRTLYCLFDSAATEIRFERLRDDLNAISKALLALPGVLASHACIPDGISAAASAHRRESSPGGLPAATLAIRIADTADVDAIMAGIDSDALTVSAGLCHEREVMAPVSGADGRVDGSVQFCSFRRKPGLSHDDFLAIWRSDHTDIAIKTQSTFGYRQYAISEVIAGAIDADAIVEEHFPAAAMTDPMAYFDASGDPSRLKHNVEVLMASCDRFIDPASVNVLHMGEYHFR